MMASAYEGKPLMEPAEEGFVSEACGCGCFKVFMLKWRRRHEDEGKHLLQRKGEGGGDKTWLAEKLKKMKEISEVVAGPKWKTFIRKISWYGNTYKQKNRFQYDERSYNLNFSSGAQSEDDDDLPPTFSTRFIVPFASATPRTES